MTKLNRTPIFNSDWYEKQHLDVKMLGMDPAEHYLKYGGWLRRDPSPFFDAQGYAAQHNLGEDENPVLHFIETFGAPPAAAGAMPLNDLKTKLWGGFSGLTVDVLKATFGSSKYTNKDKGEAAFLLGRWYALNEDWGNATKYLRMISKFDVRLFRNLRCKLLLIDVLTRAGEHQKAQDMIDFVLQKELNGHVICAHCNLLYAQNGMQAASARLEALNKLYRDSGLTEMKLADPAKGMVFGNWAYDMPQSAPAAQPKISVLMPVYGAEEFIEVAVRSMLAQTWQNLEIIAVEDRSPDNSWEKLQKLAQEDGRLKIFRNDVNMGAYPTRNKALSLATGDFITVHDSDDWSHPQMLEVQMRALQENPDAKGACSGMARVYPDLRFILRPQRNNLEFIHRSYPSLLMRRRDIDELKEWDLISANADDEFIQRLRALWGEEALLDVMPNVPLSLFLVHENSLTQQKGTNLNSLTFGIRKEYARQAKYWRENKLQNTVRPQLEMKRTSMKHPFPIPAGLAPKNWAKNTEYDIVLISDLSLLGGTRRCNEGYIEAATALGLRVGLFHWPRYDLRLTEIADDYIELSYQDNVDILVPEDEITAKLILIHHPPILNYPIDAVPQITADKLAILVNQSPMQRWSNAPHYYEAGKVQTLCQDLFGLDPEWVAISPRVRNILEISGGFDTIHDAIWFPPFHGEVPTTAPAMPAGFGSDRPIVIGRHARDHWSKWPAHAESLLSAYCGNEHDIHTRFLGGDVTPRKLLSTFPDNWTTLEFDSVKVSEFVQDLDFFLHFVHEDYIEEFGRNVMEAMAAGRVAILPPSFKDIFDDAAVYCHPDDVARTIRALWADPARYQDMVDRGLRFVQQKCATGVAQSNLHRIMEQTTARPVNGAAL